uniref:Uncharacterized protein n=1 Tax=viral metagenome TaxID=1070528 RepID=A0A6M3J5X0_9ZZZZ
MTDTTTTPIDASDAPTWDVFHGGALHGLGHWSGPHASLDEARASARACRMIVGGAPAILRTDPE